MAVTLEDVRFRSEETVERIYSLLEKGEYHDDLLALLWFSKEFEKILDKMDDEDEKKKVIYPKWEMLSFLR